MEEEMYFNGAFTLHEVYFLVCGILGCLRSQEKSRIIKGVLLSW